MGGGAKRPGGHGGGRGSKKTKYLPNKISNQALPVGSRGILITCDAGWEDRTVEEMYGVIDEHYEKLAGVSKSAAEAPSSDMAAALEAEVAELKDKKKKRFQVTHPGVRGCVYLEFPKEPALPSPVDVVVSMCDEAVTTKTLRGRHVNRLLPIASTCYAKLEEMETMAKNALQEDFPKDGPMVEFAVEYEHRSSDKFERLAVIDTFVKNISTPPHKVNLSGGATKTILVQIARNSCGVSVVPRYKELSKFNLRTCAQIPEEGEEAAGGKKDKPAPKVKPEAAEAAPAADAVPAAEAQQAEGTVDAGAEKPTVTTGNEGEAGAAAAAAAELGQGPKSDAAGAD